MKEEQRAALHKRKLKMKEEVEMHLHGIQVHLKLAFEKSAAAAMGGGADSDEEGDGVTEIPFVSSAKKKMTVANRREKFLVQRGPSHDGRVGTPPRSPPHAGS